MIAGLFDPGSAEAGMSALTPGALAVYEPDASLSLAWGVPEDDDSSRCVGDDLPEWLVTDSHEWGSATRGWAVVLLNGSPIWQTPIWYIDWGSGIGGHVAGFSPQFKDYNPDDAEDRGSVGWRASQWATDLAALIESFSPTAGQFASFNPTARLVPYPSRLHPVDAAQR
jgi:hypothetical protein